MNSYLYLLDSPVQGNDDKKSICCISNLFKLLEEVEDKLLVFLGDIYFNHGIQVKLAVTDNRAERREEDCRQGK